MTKARQKITDFIVPVLAALMIVIGITAVVYAGQNEDTIAAYQRGDYGKAFSLAEPLALQGDAQAQFALGIMYSDGKGVRQNDAEAAKWFRKSAEQGFAKAQYNLGNSYHQGRGVGQSHREAAKWYRKAAEQGFALAQFNLGNMYARGAGVEQNDAEAVKWYRLAAEQGDKDAPEMLRRLNANTVTKHNNVQTKAEDQKQYADRLSSAGQNEDMVEAYERGDYDKAFSLAEPLALRGDAQAQNVLGVMYANGHGVRQNDEEAIKWYRKSAEQGFAKAQYHLGNLYLQGRGVGQSDKEAAKWYRKSAEQGFVLAQFNLGTMYLRGDGVEWDRVEAVKWYRLAVEQRNKNALEMLSLVGADTITRDNNAETKAEEQKKCKDRFSFAGIAWTDTPQDAGKKLAKSVNAVLHRNTMNDPKGAAINFGIYKYWDIDRDYDQACGSALLHHVIDPHDLSNSYVKDIELFFTKSSKLLYYVIYFWSQYEENVYDSMKRKYGVEKERSNGWAVWDCGSERLYLQLKKDDFAGAEYSRKAIYINVSDIKEEIKKCRIVAGKRNQQINDKSRNLF